MKLERVKEILSAGVLVGEDKLDKALEAASEMLAQKGISFTELELRVLIEAAVASFNDAFNKGSIDNNVAA